MITLKLNKAVRFLFMGLVLLAAVGCVKGKSPEPREFEITEALGQSRNDFAVLVDVRNSKDFEQEHAPAARSVPLSTMQAGAEWASSLPRDKEVIFYGETLDEGKRASQLAQEKGLRAGYSKGYGEWRETLKALK